MLISPEQFEKMVIEAIDSLPDKYRERLHNVAILVEDRPSPEQRRNLKLRGKHDLLGLYEGYNQSSRQNIGPVLPDRITLFRIAIMQSCFSQQECRDQIKSTLRHEIAHHFGSDETGARKAGRKPKTISK